MTVLKVSVPVTIALLLAACGGTPECLKPQPYQQARLGQPIEVPDGLDPLDPSREMSIPQASPRSPRSASSRCLEYPPTFNVGEPAPRSEPASESESTTPESTQ